MLRGLLAACLLAGCGLTSDSSSSSFDPDDIDDSEAVGWRYINAAQGGVVDIPDGASLEIPAGALEQDTLITVRVPRTPSPIHRVYVLEPDGTEFRTPAILHIPYTDNSAGKDPMAVVYAASDLHPELDAGSELTNWAPLDIYYRDEGANILSVELDHFTFVYATFAVNEGAYLVLDIPWQYLRPADILFTLTKVGDSEGPNWQPGHVGLLRKTPGGPKAHPAGTLIESTPPNVTGGRADFFKTEDGHLYLGARRPKGQPLSDDQRKAVVDFAFSKLGAEYSKTGQGNHGAISPVGTEDTFSCVGLVEAAYDTIDRGMLNLFREVSVSTPLEMFINSEPVTTINLDVGDTLELPIYGVVVDTDSPYIFNTLRGWYQHDYNYAIQASGLPDGATFTGSATAGYSFKWIPTVEQVCNNAACTVPGKAYDVTFIMDATPRATVMGSPIGLDPVHIERTLTIRVLGNSATKTITAIGAGFVQHVFSVEVPDGAVITGSSFVDLATGQPPSSTPFPNHTLSDGYEDCGATSCIYSVTLTNTGPSQGGSVELRYYVDYELAEYDGH